MALVKVRLIWLTINDQLRRAILKSVKKFPVLQSPTVVVVQQPAGCHSVPFYILCVVSDVARHREHSFGATGAAPGLAGESVRLRHRAGHPSRSDAASARIRRGGAADLPG